MGKRALYASNLGINLEQIAFRIGKVHGAVSPRLVRRRLQESHALSHELVVAVIDLGWRYEKSQLHAR